MLKISIVILLLSYSLTVPAEDPQLVKNGGDLLKVLLAKPESKDSNQATQKNGEKSSEESNTSKSYKVKLNMQSTLSTDCKEIESCKICNWHQINEEIICHQSGYIQTFHCKSDGKVLRPCKNQNFISSFFIQTILQICISFILFPFFFKFRKGIEDEFVESIGKR